MSEISPTTYDELPYDSNPFHNTHPDCLATVAKLFGANPPAVESCRVLELGCASGGNLIPMAYVLPKGQFLGLDLSPRQIAEGQAIVAALGLANIELRAMSILDVDAGLGEFDYILCHGVYSWVPAEVQDKILDICKRNLASNGVAYVSYNTYPGWHVRGMVRDMLRFHAQRFEHPRERVQQARAFLEFLSEEVRDRKNLYGHLLQEEALQLAGHGDSYIFHEQLETVNEPLYFHEFAQRAAGHGLQYLGEARFNDMAGNLSPKVKQTIEGFSSDPIQQEQYLDFLRDRTFRRTLLCHDDLSLNRTISPRTVFGMFATSLAMPSTPDADVCTNDVEEFTSSDGPKLSTNMPLVKTALHVLYDAWPGALTFDSLWIQVNARLGKVPSTEGDAADRDRWHLAGALLQCFVSGLAELHVFVPACVLEASERPRASVLARLQAKDSRSVTNRRHRVVELNGFDHQVLRLLDGSRDRAALAEALAALPNLEGPDGKPIDDTMGTSKFVEEWLEPSLHRLAMSSLLER